MPLSAFAGSIHAAASQGDLEAGDNENSTALHNTAVAGHMKVFRLLVEVDGLALYHAGDHAGWREGEREGFTRESADKAWAVRFFLKGARFFVSHRVIGCAL